MPNSYKLLTRYSYLHHLVNYLPLLLLIAYNRSFVASDDSQLKSNAISNRPPIFDRNNYDASIPEGKDKDYPVVNVSATDLDGHELSYSLSSILEHRFITTLSYQSPQSLSSINQLFEQQQHQQHQQQQQFPPVNDAEFKIDNKTGAITTNKPLDRERVSSYTLIITVSDNGQPRQTDTAKVYVEVTDINDSPPIFTQSNAQSSAEPQHNHQLFGNSGTTIQLSQNISESVPIYTPVLKVHALDNDVGLNAQLKYTFAGGNDCEGTFTIDPNSGVIRTNKLLDRELHSKYELVALAIDRGQPPLNGSVAITIYVDDVNDNAPQWLSPDGQMVTLDKLHFMVSENSPIGTVVAALQATDLDEGENARILYEISGGVDAKSFNLIQRDQPDRAELVSAVDFNYESGKIKYNLVIRASSMSLKSDIDIEIEVMDENDNKPQLEDFSIIFNNYRNHFPTTPIGKIPAYDADISDKLTYKIISGNNALWLLVNGTTGEIQLSPSLNSNVPMRAVFEIMVSDGQFEVTATCLLVVNLITDNMLQNSIMMQVDNISRDEFMTHKYDSFVRSLAHILACQADGIVLFDIQEYQPTNIINNGSGSINSVNNVLLNVSFSARLPESRDTEAYYSGQYLQERIYLNRPLLSQKMGLQVLPFEDSFCVREPCLNYQRCQQTYKFGNASKTFIPTRTMLFRPVTPLLSYTCECPQSFTGEHYKYECDVEINQCFSNPCQNGGICHRHELGYSCECRPGFIGRKCELSFTNSSCQSMDSYQLSQAVISPLNVVGKQQSGICSGGTKCVNLNKTSLFVPPQIVNHQLSGKTFGTVPGGLIGGFKCQGCQASAWSNELCQLRARSFSRGSYLTLPGLRQRNRLHISLRFATRQSDALLLYNGRYNDRNDFIALELVDSRLKFSFSLGSNISSVSLPRIAVSDGNWHKVSIDYLDRQATLLLDDCDPILDQELAKLQHAQQQQASAMSTSTESIIWSTNTQYGEQSSAIPTIEHAQISSWRRCSNTTQMELESRCSKEIESCHRFLDLSSPLQLGALPVLPTKFQVQSGTPLTGCISDLYIDHQLIDLNQFVANNATQAGCQEKRSFCHVQPCQNGGTCHDAWGTYSCSCTEGYYGHDCSQVANQTGGGVRRFGGNSHVTYVPSGQSPSIMLPWYVRLNFRTIQPNGALIRIHLESTIESSSSSNIIALDIVNGALRFSYQSQMLTLSGGAGVDDGQWHSVQLNVAMNKQTRSLNNNIGNIVQIILDYGQYEIEKELENGAMDLTTQYVSRIIVGAASTSTTPTHARLNSRDLNNAATSISDSSEPSLNQDSSTYYNMYNRSTATTTASSILLGYQSQMSSPSFVGCIQEIDIAGQSTSNWLLANKDERNVEIGCQQLDSCSLSTCMENASCVQYGMSQHKCVCQPGFVATEQGCVSVCSLNICQGASSKCHPTAESSQVTSLEQNAIYENSMDSSNVNRQQNNHRLGTATQQNTPVDLHGHFASFDSGYQCDCDPTRSGRHCEHSLSRKCPSNWWGHPISGGNFSICGPCQCDESKGFDGDCHKTTGQCNCKSNHYQPESSDRCLSCDCYTIGSLGGQCHSTTGQCRCRPGVIGRRCDTCPSPYAEVTLRGCEVIYDACPKSYSDGIWWDKTPYKQTATRPCPDNTFGNATRVCDEANGWQEVDLFNCISASFFDLYTQFIVLERDHFPLNTNLATKLASNLRQAFNQSATEINQQLDNPKTIYGSDLFVAFRLLHHLIHFETHQNGSNLSHKQDRMYIRNLVESTSALLDPKHSEDWARLSKISSNGGAEQLLKMFDQYGRVLIDNQLDTFTQPFEVASKYFTFGMDTISTDQLLDSTRSSSSNPAIKTESGDKNNIAGVPTSSNRLYNQDGSPVYLDYSVPGVDASPAIAIPKYNNYAPDRLYADEVTKAIIPLRALKIELPHESINYQSGQGQTGINYRSKRDLMIGGSSINELSMKRAQNDQYRLPKTPSALVVYSIYQTLGSLLPGHDDGTIQHRLGNSATTNAPVVWLTMKAANSTEFMSRNLQPKVSYILKVNKSSGKTRPQCVVWNFTPSGHQALPSSKAINSRLVTPKHHQNSNQESASDPLSLQTSHSGRFSARGCELRGISHDHSQKFRHDYINCTCDHLGAVTVLMDDANVEAIWGEGPINNRDIGLQLCLIISIIFLSIAYFVMTCIRGHSINSNSNSINRNMVLVLIFMEALILLVSRSRASIMVTYQEYQCKMVAIFLHYLSISLFCWIFINSTHLLRMLTEIRDINHGPMKFYHIMGFAVPAVFVSIAVGLRIEQFGNYLFCWLSIRENIIWSMFGPIFGLILATSITSILSWRKSQQIKETLQSDHQNLRQLLWTTSLILLPLITAYWLAAIYSVNEAIPDYPALFPTLILIKSVVLVLIFCLLDKQIRYNLYVSWLKFQGKKIPFYEDNSTLYNNPLGSGHIDHNAPAYLQRTQNTLLPHPYGLSKPLQTGPAVGGFQSSCTDIFNNKLTISTASTTSRSTTTNTSSTSPYQVAGYAADQTDHLVDDDDHYNQSRNLSSVDAGAYGRSRSKRHRSRRNHHHKKTSRHHHHHHHHHRSSHHRDQNNDHTYNGKTRAQHHQHHDQHASKHQNVADKYALGTTTTDGNESLATSITNNARLRPANYELASSHSSDEDDMSMMTGSRKIKRHQNQRRQTANDTDVASLDNIEESNRKESSLKMQPTTTKNLTPAIDNGNYAPIYASAISSNPYGIVRNQDSVHYSKSPINSSLTDPNTNWISVTEDHKSTNTPASTQPPPIHPKPKFYQTNSQQSIFNGENLFLSN